MANLPEQVPLPDSVEQLLNRICREQNQPPIDSSIRCLLAAVGEESAFSVLTTISSCTIKYSLGGFIKRMIEVQSPSAVANTTSPRREIPVPPSTASPGSTAPRMSNHQGTKSLISPKFLAGKCFIRKKWRRICWTCAIFGHRYRHRKCHFYWFLERFII